MEANNGSTIISGLSPSPSTSSPIIELNVGGVIYATLLSTVTRDPNCLLGRLFAPLVHSTTAGVGGGGAGSGEGKEDVAKGVTKDAKGRYFVDRDGVLFRYVLDYLRNEGLVLPECFHEKERLKREAEYFRYENCSRL